MRILIIPRNSMKSDFRRGWPAEGEIFGEAVPRNYYQTTFGSIFHGRNSVKDMFSRGAFITRRMFYDVFCERFTDIQNFAATNVTRYCSITSVPGLDRLYFKHIAYFKKRYQWTVPKDIVDWVSFKIKDYHKKNDMFVIASVVADFLDQVPRTGRAQNELAGVSIAFSIREERKRREFARALTSALRRLKINSAIGIM